MRPWFHRQPGVGGCKKESRGHGIEHHTGPPATDVGCLVTCPGHHVDELHDHKGAEQSADRPEDGKYPEGSWSSEHLSTFHSLRTRISFEPATLSRHPTRGIPGFFAQLCMFQSSLRRFRANTPGISANHTSAEKQESYARFLTPETTRRGLWDQDVTARRRRSGSPSVAPWRPSRAHPFSLCPWERQRAWNRFGQRPLRPALGGPTGGWRAGRSAR